MNYSEAREHIFDGDLIAVQERHGILAALTRFFTRSPITHTGIALWIDGGLWMAELNSGRNHLVPLSQLSDVDFDVYDPPVPDRAAVRRETLEALRMKIPYGFIALVVIGMLCWWRSKVFVHWRRVIVCSGYCIMIYEKSGWSERSRQVSPGGLAEQLLIKLEVRRMSAREITS
jgi:hypothetical protein